MAKNTQNPINEGYEQPVRPAPPPPSPTPKK